MAWYWVLLIVVGVQAVALLVLWLVMRSKPPWAAEFSQALAETGVTRAKDELAAETAQRKQIASELHLLSEEYKKIAAWYKRNEDKINAEARKEFGELVGDPSRLDAKLDELLAMGAGAADPEGEAGEGQ